MNRFANRSAIVTAAASGIGLAIARQLASEGARLHLADINAEGLSGVVRELGESVASGAVLDVRDEDAITRFIDEAARTSGGLDILVNNAGIGCFGFVTELAPEKWRDVFEVTVESVFHTSRNAIPHLIRSRGSIVNIASISGLFADAGFSAYNAAKAAVINFTRTLAVDHGPDGVRANALCPGLIATPATGWIRSRRDFMEDYERHVPLGRPGEPEEIAAAVAFLASSDASYVTGTTLVADGGLTAPTGQPRFRHRMTPEERFHPT